MLLMQTEGFVSLVTLHMVYHMGPFLGPLLFIMYVNDVIQSVNCDLFLYTDDSILYTDDSILYTDDSILYTDDSILLVSGKCST